MQEALMIDPVVAGLLKRRAELVAEAADFNRKLQAVVEAVTHLDAAIQQFDPTRKPIAVSHRSRRGELTKGILTILRLSKKPMSVRDIAARIMVERGVDHHDRKALARTIGKVRIAVHRQHKHGVLAYDGGPGLVRFWRIAG